jgi:hypothetical protein
MFEHRDPNSFGERWKVGTSGSDFQSSFDLACYEGCLGDLEEDSRILEEIHVGCGLIKRIGPAHRALTSVLHLLTDNCWLPGLVVGKEEGEGLPCSN